MATVSFMRASTWRKVQHAFSHQGQQAVLRRAVLRQPSQPWSRFFNSTRSSPSTSLFTSLRNSALRRFQQVRLNGTNTKPSTPPKLDPTPHLGSPSKPSLSERMRKLSREYGWAAVGVYLALSALDLPICFLLVRIIGSERVGHYEHIVVENVWNFLSNTFGIPRRNSEKQKAEEAGQGSAEKEDEGATIWTQLALAYAIHKSVFIFVRVPLTAAVTPKVVKTLRGWGWNIGKRSPKPAKPISSSS